MLIGWMALVACNSVNGTIDGDDVPSTPTSFFVEYEDVYGNGDGLIIVYLDTVEGGCEAYENRNEDLEDEASELDLDGYVEVWEENLPEDWWSTYIWFRVDDPDDDQSGIEWKATDWDDGLEDDDEASVTLTHYTDYPSDSWSDFLASISDTYVSDEGQVNIRRHKPGELITGYFDAPYVDLDGDDEGEATINFSASYCDGAEEYI